MWLRRAAFFVAVFLVGFVPAWLNGRAAHLDDHRGIMVAIFTGGALASAVAAAVTLQCLVVWLFARASMARETAAKNLAGILKAIAIAAAIVGLLALLALAGRMGSHDEGPAARGDREQIERQSRPLHDQAFENARRP